MFASDTTIILFVLGVLVVLLIAWVIHLEIRIHRLLQGKGARTLEDTITTLVKNQGDLTTFRKEMEKYLVSVEERLRRALQSVETVRFNPFQGSGEGGRQSFSTAFLNEHGDGVVLSGLYARERMSVFSKPIQNHQSEFELTGEEQSVLKSAREKIEKRAGK